MIDLLSLQPHVVSRDLSSYIITVYGSPGSGKTTLSTKFKQPLLLAFEPGFKALPGVMAQTISDWTEFLQIIGQLKKSEVKEKFKTIVIDTVDIAADLCEQFICQRNQIGTIDEPNSFGKYHRQLEKEFDSKIRGIAQLGYGVVFISHVEDKRDFETKQVKTGPTLGKRCAKVIHRMSDIIGLIHNVYNTDAQGNETRTTYLQTRETSTSMAKSRFKYMEQYVEFSYDNLVKAVQEAIDKEASEYDNKYVTEKQIHVNMDGFKSGLSFEQIMEQFNNITTELVSLKVPNYDIVEIIEEHLGKGKTVANCDKGQMKIIELINFDLEELLNNVKQKEATDKTENS